MGSAGIATVGLIARLAGATLVALVLVWAVWPDSPPPTPSRDWTAEWRSDPPVVSTMPGGLLEASTMAMTEDFYKSESKTWWGIDLGATVSHIQALVTYRYGVPLSDPAWEIVTRGQTCVVVAPTLRPSVPVAIDTGTLREKTSSGGARFDKLANLEALRRSLTTELAERADDPTRLSLVREASRRTIGEFVEQWLVARGGEWEPDVFSSVKVYFAEEIDDQLRAQLRDPY